MLRRRDLIRGTAAAGVALLAAPALLRSARARARRPAAVSALPPRLSFTALYVARKRELWAANNVDYSMKWVQGGPLAMAALNAGEADFAA